MLKNITMPKIFIDRDSNSNKFEKLKTEITEIIKLGSLNKQRSKILTPCKINFRYESPNSKSVYRSETNNLNKKLQAIRKGLNSRPKVIFNYENEKK
jgi:hypothetical protein